MGDLTGGVLDSTNMLTLMCMPIFGYKTGYYGMHNKGRRDPKVVDHVGMNILINFCPTAAIFVSMCNIHFQSILIPQSFTNPDIAC